MSKMRQKLEKRLDENKYELYLSCKTSLNWLKFLREQGKKLKFSFSESIMLDNAITKLEVTIAKVDIWNSHS